MRFYRGAVIASRKFRSLAFISIQNHQNRSKTVIYSVFWSYQFQFYWLGHNRADHNHTYLARSELRSLIFGRGQCTGLAQLSSRVGPALQFFILTWHGLNCDQGSSRSRSKPFHCTLARLTSAITRNMLVTRVCNSFVEGLRSRYPMNISNMQQTAGVTHKWPRVFNRSRLLALLNPKKTKQKHEKGKNEACQHGPCARMTRK